MKKEEGGMNISGLEEKPFESRLGTIPDGYMGKLVVYKSGKVKLRLGDALYDVRTIPFLMLFSSCFLLYLL